MPHICLHICIFFCTFAAIFTSKHIQQQTMIYKITFSCDEVDGFRRVFEADSDATFLELHAAILKSMNFPDDQMTSFFMCNDRWEKEQEVTLIEMGSNFEYDNMIMESTRLSELMEDRGQRLIYVFDPMYERYIFGSLTEIMPGIMSGVECVENRGEAPKQLQTEDVAEATRAKDAAWEDDDMFNDSEFDINDLDAEGFQDLSWDDGSMF